MKCGARTRSVGKSGTFAALPRYGCGRKTTRLAMKCSPWKEICTSNNAAVSKYHSPKSMIGLNKRCRQSRRGNNYPVHGRAHEPREIRKVRDNLPIYIFSGSDDLVGQGRQACEC